VVETWAAIVLAFAFLAVIPKANLLLPLPLLFMPVIPVRESASPTHHQDKFPPAEYIDLFFKPESNPKSNSGSV
jgi:hypothetical protein